MLLYFLRHGDAAQNAHLHDSERPLTDLGREQAHRIGSFLKRKNIHINKILTSPLLRAKETGSIVQSYCASPHCEATEFLVNGSNPQHLLRYIEELDCGSILLTGHEPFLSEMISLLIAGNLQTNIEMKKCSLASVEINVPAAAGAGVLISLWDVKSIERIMEKE